MLLNKEEYIPIIHKTLLNQIKKALQYSIENEIKKRENCICSSNDKLCFCISKFFEKNFDPSQINSRSQSQKRNLKELDLIIDDYLKYNNKNYPNDLNEFDITSYVCLSRHLLQINPKNGNWIHLDDLDQMTNDLSFGGCINNIRLIRNKYYGHLSKYSIEFEDYDKIMKIFDKIIDNLPNLDDKKKTEIKQNINAIVENSMINQEKSKNPSDNPNNRIPYTVVAGDTCWAIAIKFGLTLDQLKALNPNINYDSIQIGQIIYVQGKQVESNLNPIQTSSNSTSPSPIQPNPSPNVNNRIPYTVVAGDTCLAIAAKYGLTLYQLKALNPNINYDYLQIGQIIYVQAKKNVNPQKSHASNICSIM